MEQQIVMRGPIERSWSRCSAAGLDQGAPVDRFAVHDTDPTGTLVRAAGPVLDSLVGDLAGTGFSALLTDADARITAMRCERADLRRRLELLGAVPGRAFAEDETGTNAIATVHATGRGMAVEAGEHYLERWRCFTCYGHPVTHPVTGELLGVLDVTGWARGTTTVLGALVRRTVRDIQHELLAVTGVAQRRLLAAYQAATRHGPSPVLALTSDLVVADRRASELLGSADHAVLRALIADAPPEADAVVELSCGPTRVDWRAVPDTAGTLLHLRPLLAEARPRGGGPLVWPSPATVVVAGEPGTGRTTAVRELIAGAPRTVLEAADVTPTTEHEWMARAARSIAAPDETTIVEDVHLLSASAALRLRRLLAASRARVVLTSCPVEDISGEVAALVVACDKRIDLPPLRTRAHEVGALATAMLETLRADATVRFTRGALEALSAHRWPGNLRELAATVTDVAARRSAGDIGVADLPEECRRSASMAAESAGDLARAERETIEAALRACGGNKMRAARRLGISRSTLYARLRALHIPG